MKLLLESQAIKHLISNDPKLASIINKIGDIEIHLEPNYFQSLVNSIIGQQLSTKAASTIINRFLELCGDITPENILNLSDESIREKGVSKPKISYMKDLALKVKAKIVNLDQLPKMEDAEIINHLTQVKGIGEWTAQMFLIFTLGRLDILPDKDLGIKKAIKALYGLDDLPDAAKTYDIGEKWAPFRSIASLYLWRALDQKIL